MSDAIVTVTLNPAVDEGVALESFVLGDVNRCFLSNLDAGGKGLNASRVIRRLGRNTLALGFLAGVTGAMIRARLDEEGVPHAFDDVQGLTRLNVMIYESAARRRSRIYLPGPRVDPGRLVELKARLESAARGVVVLGGSLAPGLPESTYGELVAWLKAKKVRCVVDTSGAALAGALAAGPALIKPDVEEAGEIIGRAIVGDDDALCAARELQRLGAESVVISQGAAGAIGVGPQGAWKAHAPSVLPQSTVGSGDSMVAGLAIALAEGGDLGEGLRLGTAAGAGTAMTPAAHLCRREDFDALLPRVRVEPLRAARH